MSIPPINNTLVSSSEQMILDPLQELVSSSEQMILDQLHETDQEEKLKKTQQADLDKKLEQVCQAEQSDSTVSRAFELVIKGANLHPNNDGTHVPLYNNLVYWLCQLPNIETNDKEYNKVANKRIDRCIRKLISECPDTINIVDRHGKIPFDYYLEKGKNLSSLLNKIPLPIREHMVYDFPQIPEEGFKYILPGDLMVILTIGSHHSMDFAHRLLYTSSSLEFMTGNVLKSYAQSIKQAIDNRERLCRHCTHSHEFDLVYLMKNLIGKFSPYQLKEFLSYIEENDGYYLGQYFGKDNETCIKRQFHYGARITKCFLRAFPEFTWQKLFQRIAELSAKIDASFFGTSTAITGPSLSERVRIFSKMNLKSQTNINELKEKVNALACELNDAKKEVQKLIDTANMCYFWNPQDTINESKTYLENKQIVVESLQEKMKKVVQALYSEGIPSAVATDQLSILHNPPQYNAKVNCLREALLKVAGNDKKALRKADYDFDVIYRIIYKDFSDFSRSVTDDYKNELRQHVTKTLQLLSIKTIKDLEEFSKHMEQLRDEKKTTH